MKVIILAGGSGSRLWPLSRERYPKQFIKFQNKTASLFQETFSRSLKLAEAKDIYVVTNRNYKFLVMGEVAELNIAYPESNIIVEPEAKNTLPAIYAGVHEINKRSKGQVIVFPSDHKILLEDDFIKVIKESVTLAKSHLITFGIKADFPNTGYGYISYEGQMENGFVVSEFKEKPTIEKAKDYVRKGYVWNSGIFLFDSELFTEEVKEYTPNIYKAFESSKNINEAFGKINKKISIDYGILEKSQKVAVVPVQIGWTDLGSFDSICTLFEKDSKGNVASDEDILIDSNNNFIVTDNGKLVTTIDVDDLVIIDKKDALLICKKKASQKVKEAVEVLKEREDERLTYHLEDYRPWGKYKVIDEEKDTFKIKRIEVYPEMKLSYQMHQHRSEHWVVVRGKAKVTIDGSERYIVAGESLYIKPKEKHRLENVGDTVLEIIEVQMGSYIGEDDIVRYEDDYGRERQETK